MKTPKEGLIDLLNWLFWLLAGGEEWEEEEEEEEIPPPKTNVIYATEAMRIFKDLNIPVEPDEWRDAWYHFPSLEDWVEAAYEFHMECPPYESNTREVAGWDCDDFADDFPLMCKKHKRWNSVWAVWGNTPQGRHAWNLFVTPDGAYEMEYQTGEVWIAGDNPDYQATMKL